MSDPKDKDAPRERWKQIPGLKNYEASNLGRIRSLVRETPKVLKQNTDIKGYSRISIFQKNYHVGALILIAFKGLRPKGMECSHLDGNPKNNKINNLKWCTSLENHSHKKLHGTTALGDRHPMRKLSSKDVLEIKKLISIGLNNVVVAKKYNVNFRTISDIRNGNTWTHLDQALAGRDEGESE